MTRVGRWTRGLAILVIGGLVMGMLAPPAGPTTTAATGAAAGSAPRPNIVVVLIDDLDASVTPYWDAMPQTRTRVRDRGLVFDQAFSTTPSCCPARASILTGKYAHNTGVFSNAGQNGGLTGFQGHGNEGSTIAVRLHDDGYRTGLFGKYLNGYSTQPTSIPPGWTDWFAFADDSFYDGYSYKVNDGGTLVTHGNAPADYSTDVVAARTATFLDSTEAADDTPFFAFVTPTAPHAPLPPAPRHKVNPWVGAGAPVQPNTYEADLSDKPWWLRTAAPYRDVWKATMQVDYDNRMGSLMATDELIAGVLDRLTTNGELDHTFVIVASDNGYNLGAHHLNDKLAPYEESVHVPLMVLGPNVPVGVDHDLVGLLDLAPTMLDLAGTPVPADVDGRSLQDLWDGSTATDPWRTEIVLEYRPTLLPADLADRMWLWAMLFDMPSYDAIRTKDHVLIRWWSGGELGAAREWELYDLRSDPYQLDNLISHPNGITENGVLLVDLLNRLGRLTSCAGATCP